MKTLTVSRVRGLKGAYRPPGDKSISHRALILGALAEGESTVRGLAPGADVQRTMQCLQALGADISSGPAHDSVRILGTGALGSGDGFSAADNPLDCGNSGTTARILAGMLAGQTFETTLTGDESLSRRPMERIAQPLQSMGAEVSLSAEGTLPMKIRGGVLSGISIVSELASAQVKSAVLLAGMFAEGATEYQEPVRSRDHTERMMKQFGVRLDTRAAGGGRGEYQVRLEPGTPLAGCEIDVPGDISSALYLVVAALLLPKSDLILKDVGLNPGRREALNVLTRMGARIEIKDRRTVSGEQRGDLHVHHSKLKGTGISPSSVPWLIDEIPVLSVAAAFAEGESYVKGAEELRAKESDRIEAIVHNLRAMGLEVGEYPDGFIMRGKTSHDGCTFESFGDHRIALAFHVAALASHGESAIIGYDAVDVSWPDFPEVVEAMKVA
jgi:3-phosphoshikimate 1-carboxyvinyltransferase